MTQDERSAGVILFRAAGADDKLYLLLDYGKHWDFPKGHVEKEETDAVAARRELAEETGITDARFVDGFVREITYFFRDKKKGLVRKCVIFFLAETRETEVTLSDEHVDAAFLGYPEALDRLTYANAKHLLRLAHEHLSGVREA